MTAARANDLIFGSPVVNTGGKQCTLMIQSTKDQLPGMYFYDTKYKRIGYMGCGGARGRLN